MTGDIWMIVPDCLRVTLTGVLPPGVNGKDVVYRFISEISEQAQGKVIEFTGPGVASLPMDWRMTIANGAVQVGALTMIFPADAVTLDYLTNRAREPFEPIAADADAPYLADYTFDLATFENAGRRPARDRADQAAGRSCRTICAGSQYRIVPRWAFV